MNVSINPTEDPLGLRQLNALEPDEEDVQRDWNVVRSAIEASAVRRRRNAVVSGFGLAAGLTLVLVLAFRFDARPGPEAPVDLASRPDIVTANEPADQRPDLIAMSQGMERQLRMLRKQVDHMPTELVVYQVELQDLIGQVDEALSLEPDADELWAQRVSLQLDLIKLYRNQLRRDMGLYASL